MNTAAKVWLKEGKEKKIFSRHPWVSKDEILRIEGKPTAGTVAQLLTSKGDFVAIGTVNPAARFAFQVYRLDRGELDTDFFRERMERCKLRRETVEDTDAIRLIFAEADGLPGLIVDSYAGHLVVQIRQAGTEHLMPIWLPVLIETFAAKSVYERSDMEGRKDEGLELRSGQLHGETPDQVLILESGIKLWVPPKTGLKTGYYIDQRETRRYLKSQIQSGDRVLDLFCYSGAFSLYAASAGALTLGLDYAEIAVTTAQKNAELNDLRCQFQQANVFEWLEAQSSNRDSYDWIIVDPPAISKTKEKKDSLKWAVWKLVYHALPLLAESGKMVVCTCTYQISIQDTLEIVKLAANDRGKNAILHHINLQPSDHPALVQFPESLYLKCLWFSFD